MRKIILLLSCLVLFACGWKDSVYPRQSTVLKNQSTQRNIQQPTAEYPKPEYQEKQGFFSKPGISPTKIAVLAPFSGQYKDLGKNIMDAAQLALFSVDEPNLILVPIDTKGTSYGAVDAANKAIEEGAKLILGPVFSKSASAIAPIAKQHNINVVSFSNDRALAGSGVFAIGFLPEQQIRRVVEFAIDQGITKFAAVLPNDAYGSVVAQELRETIAENKNTSILRTEMFGTAKNGEALRLDEYVTAAAKAASDANAGGGITNTALLIPESGGQLEQISKILRDANFDNKSIKLLGGGQWYNADAAKNAMLEGAWFSASPRDRKESFESKFESVYGYKPIALASLAYDGVSLSAALARSGDFSRQAIENQKGFIGIDGIFRFSKNGLTERGLAVMSIKDGGFEAISPAPKDFVGFKTVERVVKKPKGD